MPDNARLRLGHVDAMQSLASNHEAATVFLRTELAEAEGKISEFLSSLRATEGERVCLQEALDAKETHLRAHQQHLRAVEAKLMLTEAALAEGGWVRVAFSAAIVNFVSGVGLGERCRQATASILHISLESFFMYARSDTDMQDYCLYSLN